MCRCRGATTNTCITFRKNYLPEPAQYMIRYHSFYAWHREGAYDYLLDDPDREMLPWVQEFNPYDLYSKNPDRPIIRRT